MAITSTTSGVTDGSTTNDLGIELTFTSSKATADFIASDITVSGGTLSNFASFNASSTVYIATFNPNAAAGETVATTIDVAASKFTDAIGNNNLAAPQFNWTYDSVPPTMTITSTTNGVTDGSTTNDTSIALTFTSSKATADFIAGDITVSGGTLSILSATSSTVYTAIFTPNVAGAAVATTIDVAGSTFTDAFGNNNSAAPQFNWTYDNVPPTMTITVTDTNSNVISNSSSTSAQTLEFTFTSSKATPNFAVSDITLSSNATISLFQTYDNIVYTATVEVSVNGSNTVSVNGGAYTDAFGNNNTAASFTWTFDNVVLSLDGFNLAYTIADGETALGSATANQTGKLVNRQY